MVLLCEHTVVSRTVQEAIQTYVQWKTTQCAQELRAGLTRCVCVCVCPVKRGVNQLCSGRKSSQLKVLKGSFHLFLIELCWIFCQRASEVIAEHTVQRNTHPSLHTLCCHLHCGLLTLCFPKERHPTPLINASLGTMPTVSRGGSHVASRLFSHNSHAQTSSAQEKLPTKAPKLGSCLFNLAFLTASTLCQGQRAPPALFHLLTLIPNRLPWLSIVSMLLSITWQSKKKRNLTPCVTCKFEA